MSTLAHCLKKLNLSEHEAAILKGRVDELKGEGYEAHQAAVSAVSDLIDVAQQDRADIVGQVRAATAQAAEKTTPDTNTAGGIQKGAEAIANREQSARDKFVESVVDQFGLTVEQARSALNKLLKEKVVKIDPVGGQYSLSDGRFWDREVMRRSAGIEDGPNTFTFDDHANLINRLVDGGVTLDEYKAGFEDLKQNRDAIIAELDGMTKPKIFERLGAAFEYRWKNERKADVVKQAYLSMLADFSIGRGISYVMSRDMNAAYTEAIGRLVDETTQDVIDAYAERQKEARAERTARVEQMVAASKDPKTLEDFQSYFRVKSSEGIGMRDARMALTPEQRALADSLYAEKSRDDRRARADQQKAAVSATTTTTSGQVFETKHTRTGEPLFVVKAADRVDREVYNQWNATAKRLGGWYSSYRGGGAIPGFQFKTRENADAFLAYIGGNAEQAQQAVQERRNAFEDDRSQSAVERLREMADRLEESADESLGRDRKVNTHRRARMAASAERAASAEKALAQTMRSIAAGIESGTVRFLDRVRMKKQVWELRAAVMRAKDSEIRARSLNYEKFKDEPPTIETIDYAEFPSYTLYRSDLATLGRRMADVEGLKQVAQRIMSVADDVSDAFKEFAKEPANYWKLSTFTTENGTRPAFPTSAAAEATIRKSGLSGRAIPFQIKRGEWTVVMSPSEAIERKVWSGDSDKRITLAQEFGDELVEKIGKANRRKQAVDIPWQFETTYERRASLKRMGIETPWEYRAMLREFIGLSSQPAAPDKVKELERQMIGRRNDGLDFFPTPQHIADQMVDVAELQPDMEVLEPSAGWGHIAERIRAAGVEPDVVEISPDRRELLEAKGFKLVGSDFMDIHPRELYTYGDLFEAPDGKRGIMRGLGEMGSDRVRLEDENGVIIGYYNRSELDGVEHRGVMAGYDRIIMNPPFSDRRDMLHVMHAYSLLKPGGRLVAIMGQGVFFGQDKKAAEFRDWLDSVGGTSEKLDEGTFNDPSLPVNTSVTAQMVVIDKPAQTAKFHVEAVPQKSAGIPAPILTASLSRLTAAWPGVSVEVVRTYGDLPQSVRDEAARVGAESMDGVFVPSENRVYLVADRMPSVEHAQKVLLHEVFGHYGLRGSLGERIGPVLRGIYASHDGIRAQADRMMQRYGYAKEQAVEEVLSDMAAENTAAPGVWSRIVATVKQWMRERGFMLSLTEKITDNDVRVMLMKARRYAQVGSGTDAADFDPQTPDIRFHTPQPGAWGIPETSKIDDAIYSLQNKQIDMKRVVDSVRKASGAVSDRFDPYLQEELYHGRSAKGVKDFLDFELEPLLKDMRDRGLTLDGVETYLWAKHAAERNAQIARINDQMPDGGSGLTNQQAADLLAGRDVMVNGHAITGVNQMRVRDYEAIARRVQAINARTRTMLVSSGLETPETIQAWEAAYQDYVPLQREDIESSGLGTGQGFSVRGPASKRAMGSGRTVVDVLANIAMMRERTITRVEKNRVATAVMGLALTAPNADFWTVDNPPTLRVVETIGGQDKVVERVDPTFRSKPNVLNVRINGEDHFVTFNEAEPRAMRMAEALKNLDTDQLGRVLQLSSKVTRWFASVNTQYNPVFGVINLVRDTQGALLNLTSTPLAGKQRQVLGHAMSALRGIYIDARDHRAGRKPSSSWAQLYEEFQKEGGQTGYKDMFASAADRTEALQRELSKIGQGKFMAAGRAVFDWLSDYNETMENAIRLAAYKTAVESGLSKQRAASLAKNLTVNFNRKGQVATQAGALYAFFNASMQGTARIGETLLKNENGKVSFSRVGKRIVSGGLMLGVIQALMLAAAGYDDEEPPEFVRERSLIIPLPDGKYFSVPMPLGFHVIPNVGRITAQWAMGGGKNTAKHLADLFGVFADSFNPIGNAGLSLQTITPTAIDPFAALSENRDWTGKPIAREDFNPLKPTPGYLRAKDTASWISKTMAYWFNQMSGGTEFKPGVFSPTPDQLDYLIGQAFGGVGREALKIEQTVSASATGEDLPLYKVPMVGRFIGETIGQASEASKFYAAIKEINLHHAEVTGLRKSQRGAEAAAYMQANPTATLYRAAERANDQVSKLRRLKRQAIEKGEPQGRVKVLEAEMTLVMRRLNNEVQRLENRAGQ